MVVRKRRKAPRKKLMTRFKQNPLGTVRSEFKKLGPLGQIAVIGVAAGASGGTIAFKLDKLPVIGQVFSIFTAYGRKLKQK